MSFFMRMKGAHDVRWTSELRRPERSGDTNPWVRERICVPEKNDLGIYPGVIFSGMRMKGLEPTRLRTRT